MAEVVEQPSAAPAEQKPVVADEQEGAAPQQADEASAAPSEGAGKAAAGEADEEPWKRRLWFVRMPKPPEAGAIKVLEQEVETYRTQFNLITEALNVKKVERESAREATRVARDAFVQCRDAFTARTKPVKDLQDQRKEVAKTAQSLKESFSDLLVRSEAELDERLKELHYRIEHETISLNEEKKALATIKKLEQQRERVREYENSAALFAESKAKRSELQDALKEFDGELAALRQEMDVQRQIMEKLREHERGIDKEVEEVIGERRRCREVMEQAYQRLNELKKAQWEKNTAYYNNRRFSQTVRKLVESGQLDEARTACAEQMEEAHEQLSSSDTFRSEYFALWELQRKAPVLLPSSDDVDANLPPPSKAAKGSKKKAAAAEPAEPVDPTKKAEATIAALLEEAREEARRAKAAAAAAAAAEQEAAAAEAAAAAGAAAAVAAAAAFTHHEVVGLDESSIAESSSASRAHSKPAKPASASRLPAVEPVVLPPENFELPEAIKLKEKEAPPSKEAKELERERQRQAQAEAERRKQKREQEKERKRQRQQQLAKEAAEAAARATEAAASAQAAAAAALAAAADAGAASDDGSDGGGSGSGAAAAAVEQVSSVAEQRKKGPSGGANKPAGPLPVAKALAPRPAAKRPVPAKAGLVKQAKKAAKDYSVLIAGGVVLLILLVVAALFWTASSVAPQ